ncbi:MAG: 1-(5-phosphoribosyl)-5-[(5-phosphoribosylamino)methylideneamino]imidazole-4-carboxamide isomerase [Chthoniobacterales bacterium]|jgi:phosphoribosylformimino-5-aminoimidazole carboxamide ribotide isomerase
MTMLLYPAIDLMGGQVVRLKQGRASEKTVYSDDPAAVAREWERRGGDWLHIVDLDAAFGGKHANLDKVRAIAAAVSLPVQMGGGMRDEASIAAALDAGVSRVVIGTKAAEEPDFVRRAVARFGGARVAVGIDARDGMVAVKGWAETTAIKAGDLAGELAAAGIGALIYTDIATDGMLQGPNLTATAEMVGKASCPVIASGGVSSAGDLAALGKIEGLAGAIVGKALFDGRIQGNLKEAWRTAAGQP